MTGLAVLIETEAWLTALPDLEQKAQQAVAAALYQAGAPVHIEVSLLFTDDHHITALNGQFRQKQTATNVLSWPARPLEQPATATDWPDFITQESPDGFLGDVALAFETTAAEAQEAEKQLEAHVAHLIIHGVLHLCGYDHISDAEATVMEAAEIRAMASLGWGSPYDTGC